MTECTGHEFLRVRMTCFPSTVPSPGMDHREADRRQEGEDLAARIFWGREGDRVTGVSQKEQLAKVPGQSPLTFQASAFSGPRSWSLWRCLFHDSSIYVLPSERSSLGVGHLSPSFLAPCSSLGWYMTHSGYPANTSPIFVRQKKP